jgi:hypothetical protein
LSNRFIGAKEKQAVIHLSRNSIPEAIHVNFTPEEMWKASHVVPHKYLKRMIEALKYGWMNCGKSSVLQN